MSESYPVPPHELVQQWMDEFYGGPGALITTEEAFMAKRAATWGYQQCWDTYVAAATGVSAAELQQLPDWPVKNTTRYPHESI
jgi:hypothetical protein